MNGIDGINHYTLPTPLQGFQDALPTFQRALPVAVAYAPFGVLSNYNYRI